MDKPAVDGFQTAGSFVKPSLCDSANLVSVPGQREPRPPAGVGSKVQQVLLNRTAKSRPNQRQGERRYRRDLPSCRRPAVLSAPTRAHAATGADSRLDFHLFSSLTRRSDLSVVETRSPWGSPLRLPLSHFERDLCASHAHLEHLTCDQPRSYLTTALENGAR